MQIYPLFGLKSTEKAKMIKDRATNKPTDRPTDRVNYRVACTQINNETGVEKIWTFSCPVSMKSTRLNGEKLDNTSVS